MFTRLAHSPLLKNALLTIALLTTVLAPATAQLPTLQLLAVHPLGAQQGQTVEARVTAGNDLDGVTQLVFSHPGITSEPKMAPAAAFGWRAEPVENAFLVKVAADVPPGLHEVRAVGRHGISNPRRFVVSRLPEVNEPANNQTLAQAAVLSAPMIVNGTASASARDHYRFKAAKGQRWLIELAALALDSQLEPVLTLLDANGRELSAARDDTRRDPLIDFVVPADGDYVIAVNDEVFGGGPQHGYRLSIHAGPHLDFVFPAAGLPGARQVFSLYGRNLSGGTLCPDVVVDGRPLERLDVTIDVPGAPQRDGAALRVTSLDATADGFAYQCQTPAGVSNAVRLGLAEAPVALEREPNDDRARAQQIPVPCEVAGQFAAARDHDWYRFQGRKGEQLWFEVIASRLGTASDPALLVQRVTRDANGAEQTQDLREQDDADQNPGGSAFTLQSGDPTGMLLTLPDDGEYRVLVRDVAETRGDPRDVYRLVIRPPQPSFRLFAVAALPNAGVVPRNNRNGLPTGPWTVQLRRGGTERLDLYVLREEGFAGEIRVRCEGLPESVLVPEMAIGSNQDSVKLVFSAAENAAEWTGAVRVSGTAVVNGQPVVRDAVAGVDVFSGAPNRPAPARVTSQLMVAVRPEASSARVEIDETKVWEMSIAGKLEVPLKIIRAPDFKEAFELNVTGLEDPIKPATVKVAADATEAKLVLDIPPKTPAGDYTFCLQAQTKVTRPRDPRGIEWANARRDEISKLADQLAADARAAEAAAKLAADAATAADSEFKQAKADAQTALAAKVADANRRRDEAAAAAKAAADKAKAADAAKADAVKRAAAYAEGSKPKAYEFVLTSNMARLRVTNSPVNLAVAAPVVGKRGAAAQVPVTVERKYGFADAVDVELALPAGLNGIVAPPLKVAQGQPGGALAVALAPDAPAGEHRLIVRAKPKWNSQELPTETSFVLKIE